MATKNQTPKNVKNTNEVEVNLGVKLAQTPKGNATQVIVNAKSKCEQKPANSPRQKPPQTKTAVVGVQESKLLVKQQQMIIKQQNAMLKQQNAMLKQQQSMLAADQKQLKIEAKPTKPAGAQQQSPRGGEAKTNVVVNVKLDK